MHPITPVDQVYPSLSASSFGSGPEVSRGLRSPAGMLKCCPRNPAERRLKMLSTLSKPDKWHVYTKYIHGIYQVYTWHMTIYVVTQEYTSKKLYGFVLYQSRTLIDMWYPKDILGISHVYKGTWLVRNKPIKFFWGIFQGYDKDGHMPGIYQVYTMYVPLDMYMTRIYLVYSWNITSIFP